MTLPNQDFSFIAYPLVSIILTNTILATIRSNYFYPHVIHLYKQADYFLVALLFRGASIFKNLHDFRYKGGADINGGSQIALINDISNIAQDINPGPSNSACTYLMSTAEPRNDLQIRPSDYWSMGPNIRISISV